MPSRPPKSATLLVTVVSKNNSTLKGLRSYLRGAGVVASTTVSIERIVEMTPPASAAVIVFPDEYGPELAENSLSALKAQRPEILAVIVTNEPGSFDHRGGDPDDLASPVVLPKPAWVWTILDAIRARLAARSAAPTRQE